LVHKKYFFIFNQQTKQCYLLFSVFPAGVPVEFPQPPYGIALIRFKTKTMDTQTRGLAHSEPRFEVGKDVFKYHPVCAKFLTEDVRALEQDQQAS